MRWFQLKISAKMYKTRKTELPHSLCFSRLLGVFAANLILFLLPSSITAADNDTSSAAQIAAAVRDAALPTSALVRDPSGWRDLMPAASFDGWQDYPWPPGSPRTDLSLMLHDQWRVDPATGYLVYFGPDHSHLLSDESLGNFILHVEFRYTEPEVPGSNSGIFVRMVPGETVMHQVELADTSGVIIGGRLRDGTLKQIKVLTAGADGAWVAAPQHSPRDWEQLVTERTEAPTSSAPTALGPSRPIIRRAKGEWNTVEVTCIGPVIVVALNGTVTTYTDQCDVPNGAVGFEAEGHPIEFRTIQLKVLR